MVSSGDGRFESADGNSLYYRWRSPDESRGRVIVFHGATEHGDRYEHLYSALTGAGYAVAGADWRGHGRSEGLRGHVTDFGTYVEDTAALLERLGPIEGPQFVYAHSMGALVALRHAAERPDDFDGIVLAGAAIRLVREPGPMKILAAKIAAILFPLFPVNPGLRSADLSTDQAVGDAAKKDPLMLRRVTVRWGREFFRAEHRAEEFAGRITKPLLVMMGGDDPIADLDAARQLTDRVPGGLAELKVFPGLRHELHSEAEAERARVFAHLLPWLAAHDGV